MSLSWQSHRNSCMQSRTRHQKCLRRGRFQHNEYKQPWPQHRWISGSGRPACDMSAIISMSAIIPLCSAFQSQKSQRQCDMTHASASSILFRPVMDEHLQYGFLAALADNQVLLLRRQMIFDVTLRVVVKGN